MPPVINLLVEGLLDEAVARRLVRHCGATPGVTFGGQGHGYIKNRIQGFNDTAEGVPLLTLVDLMDTGIECSPEVLQQWLPHQNPKTLFRVVEREIESWLMADRGGFSDAIHVSENKVPAYPDEVADPKRTVVELASGSFSSRIREDLVPTRTTAQTGPLYNARLIKFAMGAWDPDAAADTSPSLRRAMDALEQMVTHLSE